MKANRLGGAESSWLRRGVDPMAWRIEGRKTGMLENATLQQKNMAAVR